ncbi:SPOR domain-containing protein [bacterium]|nr:MAG: SPOR domain-containing protein [bacterium]
MNNKGKASTIVIGILIVVSIIIGVAFVYTSNTGNDTAPETVSKRVKLDLKDKAPETAPAQKLMSPPTATAQKAVTPSAVAQPAKTAEKQPPKEALKPHIAGKVAEPLVKREAAKPAEPLKAEVKSTTVKEASKPPVRIASKPEQGKAAASATAEKTNLLNKPWVVNLASFISDREAQEFKKSLKKAGYNAYVTSVSKDEITWYRVRAGFFKTEADAKKTAKNIAVKFKLESEPWIAKPTRAEISKHSK